MSRARRGKKKETPVEKIKKQLLKDQYMETTDVDPDTEVVELVEKMSGESRKPEFSKLIQEQRKKMINEVVKQRGSNKLAR